MNDLPDYDTWKTQYPPEWDNPEPSEEHYARAIKFFLDWDLEPTDLQVQEKAEEYLEEDIQDSKEAAAEYRAEL